MPSTTPRASPPCSPAPRSSAIFMDRLRTMTRTADAAVLGGLHGWLVIDKPCGVTSARAVALVKRSSGATKIGHAGTLDPLATGILPLALGEATKTVQFATAGKKRYRFRVRWGEARGTVGHIAELRRLSVGHFGENQAISLDSAVALGHSLAASEHLLPLETALDDIPALALTAAEAARLRHGQRVTPHDAHLDGLADGTIVRARPARPRRGPAPIGAG